MNEKILNLAAEHGLSKAELARRAGVGYGTLIGIVNRGTRPRLDTLGKLARVLGVKPSELLQD